MLLFFLALPIISAAQVHFNYNSCPIDVPITCSNSTPIENSCCFESPGGIFLSTQFWDYDPAIGADDEWTLHGLWPDNCDGTYEQFCDRSLNIDRNIEKIIVGQFNDTTLYNKMSSYWKNFNGNDASLWQHEFNKHGTCVKTLHPSCYTDVKNQNVYDYFNITVNLYEQLNTYKFLSEAGIKPSTSKTYTKKEIAAALSQNFDGFDVKFKCDNKNALQEIWYYHHLRGSILNQDFVRIPALHDSGCKETGIKWLPKTNRKPPSPTRTNTNSPPKPTGDYGKLRLENNSGCLIASGNYYEHGTCATYHLFAAPFGGYNIKSSRGYCGVDSTGKFNCQQKNNPTQYQFQWDKSTGVIGYGNLENWCFKKDESHGHFPQTPIKLDDGECEDTFKLKFN